MIAPPSSSCYSSGAPTVSCTDSKGSIAYGYGNIVLDSDGDGKNDYFSSDGGNTWSRM